MYRHFNDQQQSRLSLHSSMCGIAVLISEAGQEPGQLPAPLSDEILLARRGPDHQGVVEVGK
jgi:hypothetical protein